MEMYRKSKISIKLKMMEGNKKTREKTRKQKKTRENVCVRFEDAFANLCI